MKNIHKCGRCLLRDEQSGQCSILKMIVAEDQDACPRYADDNNVITCELCGDRMHTLHAILFPEDDRIHIVCGDCAKMSGRCQTCVNVKECKFITDPSPIPQVVQKQIKQGPIIQIVQIMNPDRIAITCKMGCDCWDAESETCCKQTCGTCSKYKIVWE